MGERVLEYNNDFRFYITTKLSNPHYQPEVCVKVIENFVMIAQLVELYGDLRGTRRPIFEHRD